MKTIADETVDIFLEMVRKENPSELNVNDSHYWSAEDKTWLPFSLDFDVFM